MLWSRSEMIEFILDEVETYEKLTSEKRYDIVCELNGLSHKELEELSMFYDSIHCARNNKQNKLKI